MPERRVGTLHTDCPSLCFQLRDRSWEHWGWRALATRSRKRHEHELVQIHGLDGVKASILQLWSRSDTQTAVSDGR